MTPQRSLFLNLVFLLSLLMADLAIAKAPVWKVSKSNQTFFVGGTIHLLAAKDYPLPEAFQTAFEQSETLVFETDIEQASSIMAQAKFMSVLMLPAGETLKTRIKPETYSALAAFLDERKLPISMFERFTPAGLNITLVVMELQRLGISGAEGVETFMNAKAKESNKEVEWLESLDEQISFIGKMNELDADKLILSTLRDSQGLEQEWPKLLSAWKQGDMKALETIAIDRMLAEAPSMYDFILVERNKDWMSDIHEYAATPEVEFILVGALHLAGKDSVLSMLKSNGYSVEQLD